MRFAILRKILGLSQQEIAKKIGITQPSWAELEKQTKEMKKKTTLEVLKFRFGVNPEWLLGKSHSLFYDWEKGLEIVKDKAFQVNPHLSKWELLFLTEVMHYVWSMPFASKTSRKTRVEFIKALIDSIKHFFLTHEIKNIESLISSSALALFGRNIFEVLEAVQKLPSTVQLARELASILLYFLKNDDFEISEEDEKVLSSFLLPWSYYVGLSYNTIEQNLIPLSSIYFSSLEELFKFEKKSEFEKVKFIFERNNVCIEFKRDKLDIHFKEKLKITLDISEVFAFFVLLAKREKVDGFSVLSFSISQDKFTNFINLTFNRKFNQERDKKIEVMLNRDEFGDLIELIKEIKQDRELLLCLQKFYLDKYGFV